MRLLLSPLLLLLSVAGPLEAEEPDWAAAEEGIVAAVLAGDSLLLRDGRELRLAGVRVPRAPLAYRDAEIWRREEAAHRALQARAAPETSLRFVKLAPAHDRHRRLLVQASNADGLWLQEDLLSAGAVLLDRPQGALLAPLVAAERAARETGRGLWADPAHAPLPATAAEAAIGRFAVVEGRVLAADEVRGLGYLNFGEDWREDFTIRLPRPALRQLEAQERRIEHFAGRRVSVRGWVFYSGGPMIEVQDLSEVVELPE